MFIKIILSFIIFLSTLSLAHSAIPYSKVWELAGWDGGGAYCKVLFDKTIVNRVYVISDVAGAWFSNDSGDHWNFMNTGLGSMNNATIAQSPSNPDFMIIVGTGGTYKSITRGATWYKVASYTGQRYDNNQAVAFNRENPDEFYIGADNGNVYRTLDGGSTWSTLAVIGGKIYALFMADDNTHLFISRTTSNSTTPGLYIADLRDDSISSILFTGHAYANKNSQFASYIVPGETEENICTPKGDRLTCTKDYGNSWTDTALPGISASAAIWRFDVAITDDDEVMMLIYGNNRFAGDQYHGQFYFRSYDAGTTWEEVAFNFTKDYINNPTNTATIGADNPGSAMSVLTIDQRDSSRVFMGSQWGVFRSNDSGTSFYEKVYQAQNTVTTSIKVAPDNQLIATSMDNGLLTSTDGRLWNARTYNQTYQWPEWPGHVWDTAIYGSQSDWQAGNGEIVAIMNTWNNGTSNEPYVYISTDNGVTWTQHQNGIPTYPITAGGMWGLGYMRTMAVSPNDPNIIYVAIDGTTPPDSAGVYKSIDRGRSFVRMGQPRNPNTGNYPGFFNGLAVVPSDLTSNTLYFATFCDYSYRSTDGGVTWEWVNNSDDNWQYSACNLQARFNAGVLYVGGIGGKLFRSLTGGVDKSLELIKTFDGLNSNTVLLGFAFDPLNTKRMALCTGNSLDGKLYITETLDRGVNAVWQDITGNFPIRTGCYGMTFRYGEGTEGYLYAASNGGGIFKLDLATTAATELENVTIGE